MADVRTRNQAAGQAYLWLLVAIVLAFELLFTCTIRWSTYIPIDESQWLYWEDCLEHGAKAYEDFIPFYGRGTIAAYHLVARAFGNTIWSVRFFISVLNDIASMLLLLLTARFVFSRSEEREHVLILFFTSWLLQLFYTNVGGPQIRPFLALAVCVAVWKLAEACMKYELPAGKAAMAVAALVLSLLLTATRLAALDCFWYSAAVCAACAALCVTARLLHGEAPGRSAYDAAGGRRITPRLLPAAACCLTVYVLSLLLQKLLSPAPPSPHSAAFLEALAWNANWYAGTISPNGRYLESALAVCLLAAYSVYRFLARAKSDDLLCSLLAICAAIHGKSLLTRSNPYHMKYFLCAAWPAIYVTAQRYLPPLTGYRWLAALCGAGLVSWAAAYDVIPLYEYRFEQVVRAIDVLYNDEGVYAQAPDGGWEAAADVGDLEELTAWLRRIHAPRDGVYFLPYYRWTIDTGFRWQAPFDTLERAFTQGLQTWVLEQLEKSPPEYLVFDTEAPWTMDSRDMILEPFLRWFATNYTICKRFGRFTVTRRQPRSNEEKPDRLRSMVEVASDEAKLGNGLTIPLGRIMLVDTVELETRVSYPCLLDTVVRPYVFVLATLRGKTGSVKLVMLKPHINGESMFVALPRPCMADEIRIIPGDVRMCIIPPRDAVLEKAAVGISLNPLLRMCR